MAALIIFALVDFLSDRTVRRTFVFPKIADNNTIVEERFLKNESGGGYGDRVTNKNENPTNELRAREIRAYVEEALLGPGNIENYYLFPRDSELLDLFVRGDEYHTLYIHFSDGAALPNLPRGDGEYSLAMSVSPDINNSIKILASGLKRNFPYLARIHVFIGGVEVGNF
jgi:hypothetical protein